MRCARVLRESVSYLKIARGSLNDMLSWCVPFYRRGNCQYGLGGRAATRHSNVNGRVTETNQLCHLLYKLIL